MYLSIYMNPKAPANVLCIGDLIGFSFTLQKVSQFFFSIIPKEQPKDQRHRYTISYIRMGIGLCVLYFMLF